MTEDLEILQGAISAVVYQNYENGYAVLRVNVGGGQNVISGPTTGAIIMKVEEIRVDLKPVEKTVRGERFSIKVDERVRPSDKLYVWRDVEEVRRQRVIK